MANKKVIILGGGVAGMSAAHELIERGFDVQVFERKLTLPGGKARSVPVPDPDAGPHYNPLPGEHGFRFFPGFYKHVIDTMKRIPFPGNQQGVFDNLVPAPHVMMARAGKPPLVMLDSFPKNLAALKFMLHSAHQHTGLTHEEIETFAGKIWQLMTSSHERRENDYEKLGWWEFTEGQFQSETYQNLLAKGLTRTLVAARARTASTKTGGDIFLQLIFNMANPSVATDRILNGPTNERWLAPWHSYLVDKGVDYQFASTVTKIDCTAFADKQNSIAGVWVSRNGGAPEHFTADYYIMAVPVEVAANLLLSDVLKPGQTWFDYMNDVVRNAYLTDREISILDITTAAIEKAAIFNSDPCLDGIIELASDVSWMTGVQFYLNEEVNLNQGHIIFSDSPWAVTAISQLQFWKDFKIDQCADGKVKSILSCDVSEWNQNGLIKYPGYPDGKIARDCSPEEIKNEVWLQMKSSLQAADGTPMLRDDMIHTWFIDRDIKFDGDYASKDQEPLLVNKVDTWRLRPNSYTDIPNLFMASDYVRTHTDLATMEGANEAARRAVNNIIERSGSDASLCEIWNLHEPWEFSHLRAHDKRRYLKGLVWKENFPWWVRLLQWIVSLFKKGAKKG